MPTWQKIVTGGAVLTLLALVGLGINAIQRSDKTAFGTVAVLVNEDANVAGNGLEQIKDQVTAAATDLAKQGGGRLVIAKAGGGPAQQVAATDLSVIGPDGQTEHDPETRERITGDRIAAAFAEADTKRVAEPGRNILSLLTMAKELAPEAGQTYQVFLVGFGLGTEDPADARIQTGGDPSQAVDALAGRLPDLSGAEINLFFPAAAGVQQPLNVATSAWREAVLEGPGERDQCTAG